MNADARRAWSGCTSKTVSAYARAICGATEAKLGTAPATLAMVSVGPRSVDIRVRVAMVARQPLEPPVPTLCAFPITSRWPPAHPDRLRLYSLNSPNGMKVAIMLEETGLPYEAHLGDFGASSPQLSRPMLPPIPARSSASTPPRPPPSASTPRLSAASTSPHRSNASRCSRRQGRPIARPTDRSRRRTR